MHIILKKIKSVYRRLSSLRWKLFYSFLILGIVPLLFYANTSLRTMEDAYMTDKIQELLRYANQAATHITSQNFLTDPQKTGFFNDYIRQEMEKTSNRMIVVDATGKIVNDSSWADTEWWAATGRILLSPDVLNALDNKSSWSIQTNKEYMSLAVAISGRGQGEATGVLLVISSMGDKNTLISSMNQKLILLTVLLCIIILIIVFFISQMIIEPLKDILSMVKRISEGRWDQRVKINGYDEFAELGASFNDMTIRLEKVEEARSEFVSNVSHELKTPLSSVKVLSESLLLQDDVDPEVYKEFLIDINSEVDRMTKIVNDLLALVILDRMEQGITFAPVKLDKVLEDVIKRLRPLADQKNIDLYYSDSGAVTVEGDEMKLELALSNVIENSIKYTNNDGSVTVSLETDSQNAVITVKDTGIGISEADQAKIFDRFYRVDKTRGRDTGGTGLGLSITYKTVLLHNGVVKLQSKENEGSVFVIRLPMKENKKMETRD